MAGVTVASAKSFRTLSRSYPDRLVLVMAPASPEPLWVFVLIASSREDSPDMGYWDCCHGLTLGETEARVWQQESCAGSLRAGHSWALLSPALRVPLVPLSHWGAVPGSCCVHGIDTFPFAHSGLRATAKITYQAVLLENLVCPSVLLFLTVPVRGQGTTVPGQTSLIHGKQGREGIPWEQSSWQQQCSSCGDTCAHTAGHCWGHQQCRVLPCRE